MGYTREHFLAWAAGTNYKDFSAAELVLQNTYQDGFVIPVPTGAFAVTLFCNVIAKNDTNTINLKLLDSPDQTIWAPAQVRTNEVIAAPNVSYDMLDSVYNMIGVVTGMQKAFRWNLTMSEFIKLSITGDGAAPATFKGIFVFGIER